MTPPQDSYSTSKAERGVTGPGEAGRHVDPSEGVATPSQDRDSSASGPRASADFVLPDIIGLCPDHGGEFYMPLSQPLNSPFLRCPLGGCERLLVLYGIAGQP